MAQPTNSGAGNTPRKLPDPRKFYAHSENPVGHWQTMEEHTREVTRLAGDNAAPFGERDKAELTGTIHDIGKYGDSFNRRLLGLESGLDHWSPGAWMAFAEYRLPDVALAVQGHHIGLQAGNRDGLSAMRLKKVAEALAVENRKLTEANTTLLRQRLEADGFVLPPVAPQQPIPETESASAMLDVRMLFSALTDADFRDTERHMNFGDSNFVPRPQALALQPVEALRRLEAHLEKLNADAKIPEKTRRLRGVLADACAEAGAKLSHRLFTLTGPTGTGKTFGMLRFGLTRAVADPRIRRIIVVLPFLTILDQTVAAYHSLFADLGVHYILEHHSLTGTREQESKPAMDAEADEQRNTRREARLLTENWDAPIIITTSVQFLESLFSNRPGACRKLHNIAGSIILFDEVQTLPVPLAVSTLKTLSRLTDDKYGSVVVFSTATQPAFNDLDTAVRKGETNGGWQPHEIVPSSLNLYNEARRVRVDWNHAQTGTAWETVADWLTDETQALCIVNIKDHARDLATLLTDRGLQGVQHLSTNLCPAHRRAILKTITQNLDNETNKTIRPCRLVATQCVEAGVDLDFPRAFRALGPFEAVAQAAGRCNRSGKIREGILSVFLPVDARYPEDNIYKRATAITSAMLREFGDLDINDPVRFTEYFRRLYTLSDAEKGDTELADAILRQDYKEVAKLYRLIDNATVNVVVPYNDEAMALMDQGVQQGIGRQWIQEVRPYTVSVFVSRKGGLPTLFERVKMFRTGEDAPDWYICRVKACYDPVFGLKPDANDPSTWIC